MAKLVKAFTQHLRERRRAMGLTQEQLAERSGFSTNYIARLEIGMSVPSLASLAKLSKALKIGVPALLSSGDEPTSPDEACAGLLSPLNEQERQYVLGHVRNTVNLILSIRKMEEKQEPGIGK